MGQAEVEVIRRNAGVSLLELIIVMGIFAILVGLGAVGWNSFARRTAAQGAVATFQQSVWQGATAAASRGIIVELVREGNELQLINTNDGNAVLRRYEIPAEVTFTAENPILRFLPPGKVELGSLQGLGGGLTINTGEGTYDLNISIIGEVKSEKVGDG